jgi:hypothetical protein
MKKLIKLSDYQKGYIEAMIDGEGCICLSKPKKKTRDFTLRPEIKITNTNLDILLKIKRILNKKCSVNIVKRPYPNKPQWATCYLLRLHSDGASEILSQIKLVIKEKKRKIALKVMKVLKERKGGFGTWNPNYKDDVLKKYYKEFLNA